MEPGTGMPKRYIAIDDPPKASPPTPDSAVDSENTRKSENPSPWWAFCAPRQVAVKKTCMCGDTPDGSCAFCARGVCRQCARFYTPSSEVSTPESANTTDTNEMRLSLPGGCMKDDPRGLRRWGWWDDIVDCFAFRPPAKGVPF